MVHESTKSTRKTLARDAERRRRLELEETWNKVKPRSLPPTFEYAADEWLTEARPHLASRTQDIYDVAIRCHLQPAFGRLLLCDIDSQAIGAYQARRKKQKAAIRTLNKELQVLRQILKKYKFWSTLQGDVKFERDPANIGKALVPQEESKLLAACESNALLHTVVSLALNTALRANEIRTLHWSQIDLFKRTLTVGHTKTEGGSGRVIPLNSIAYAALLRWAGRFPDAEDEHYAFPSCENARIDTNHPYATNLDATQPIKSWRTAWRRALTDAGIQIRFHDLRHCCITKLAESQTSEQTIMAIAGHLSRAMVEHYSHIRMEAKRVALDGIAKQPEATAPPVGVHQNVHQISDAKSGTFAKPLN